MRLTASSSHVMAALLLASPLVAQGAPPDLDRYVARVMKTFTGPGLSVAIVKDGRVVMAKGYGVRRLGDPAPVDEHTRFGIASNTKLFTATALELLVEEGKVAWDAPVIRYGSIARLRLVPSSPLVDFSFDFQDLDLRPVPPDSKATQ